ncbi:MAG: Thiazole biosynthesis protein ThiG, partial [Mycobacterium sp.]|nr:Thiazole biosynthesis protein ThiG [Mycobacterium sp.]
MAEAKLTIAGRTFGSRLVIGTGGFRNLEVMGEAVRASGADLATLAASRWRWRARWCRARN